MILQIGNSEDDDLVKLADQAITPRANRFTDTGSRGVVPGSEGEREHLGI